MTTNKPGENRKIVMDWLQWCDYPNKMTYIDISKMTMDYILQTESALESMRQERDELKVENNGYREQITHWYNKFHEEKAKLAIATEALEKYKEIERVLKCPSKNAYATDALTKIKASE